MNKTNLVSDLTHAVGRDNYQSCMSFSMEACEAIARGGRLYSFCFQTCCTFTHAIPTPGSDISPNLVS